MATICVISQRICVIEHQILNKVSYKQRPLYIALFMLPLFFLYVVGVLEKYVKRMLDQTDKSVVEFEDCLN
jgi:hypothetical protein